MIKETLVQIEEIIKACDGDPRGALRVLMLINQELRLEVTELQSEVAELQQEVDADKTYPPRRHMRASMH